MKRLLSLLVSTLASLSLTTAVHAEDWVGQAREHRIDVTDFSFDTGETLPKITMHAFTLGEPERTANGEITNAVMSFHGTGGSAASLLRPFFGDAMFGHGQPLDSQKYHIISPSNLGHGTHSRPNLWMDELLRFPGEYK